MKNQELFNLQAGIQSCLKVQGTDIQLKLCKNLDKVTKEIEIIQKTETFIEHEKKRIKLVKLHVKKDENNQPILFDGQRYVLQDAEKFQDELNKLEMETGYRELMDAEADIKLWRIKEDDLPKNMDGNQINGIFKLIDFNLEKEE